MSLTYIYTLSDETGIRYVGKSNNPTRRFKDHLKECKKRRSHKEKWLYSIIQSGEKVTLEILDEIKEDEWNFSEIYWICQLKSWGFSLVNGTMGGEGSDGFKGKKHTLETKAKCAEAAKKVIFTEQIRNKISESNKLRIISQNSRDKMSKSAKLRLLSTRIQTQETKDRIAKSLIAFHKTRHML